MKEKLLKFAYKFSIRMPRLFVYIYVWCHFCFCAGCAFVPYIIKCFAYSIFFTEQQVVGVIEKSYKKLFFYFIKVNDIAVKIPRGDYKRYKLDKEITYFEYSLGDMRFGEIWEYDIVWGIIGICALGLITFLAYVFVFSDDYIHYEKEKNRTQKMEHLPKGYEELQVKELYELCEKYDVYIKKEARKNRARLLSKLRYYERLVCEYEQNEEQRKSNKKVFIIYTIALIVIDTIIFLSGI